VKLAYNMKKPHTWASLQNLDNSVPPWN